MKKIWLVLFSLLAIELLVVYTPDIVNAIDSWLNFRMEMTIVANDNPGEEDPFVFVLDMTGTQEITPITYWGDVDQGQYLDTTFYIKNTSTSEQFCAPRLLTDVGFLMTQGFEPESATILPGEVVSFLWEANVFTDAPEGEYTIYGDSPVPEP